MKRHLAIILIFLILGAILNVAVAWGCVLKIEVFKSMLRIPKESGVYGDVQISNERWYFSRRQSRLFFVGAGARIDTDITRLPQYTIINSLMHGEPTRVYAQLRKIKRKPPVQTAHVFVAWGWPNQSMWFRVYVAEKPSRNQYYSGGLVLDQQPPWRFYRTYVFPRALPLYIFPTSFCLNSLFYAVILWLPYGGYFTLRRHRRIRRGLCGRCGYIVSVNADDPNASPNCTECGTPIPRPGRRIIFRRRRRMGKGIMQKRSHRILKSILIFFILGASLNVAVAWGCVFIVPNLLKSTSRVLDSNISIPSRIRDLHNILISPDLDYAPDYELRSYIGHCSYTIISITRTIDYEQGIPHTIRVVSHQITTRTTESGWPFPSLWDHYFREHHRDTAKPNPDSFQENYCGQFPITLSLLGINKQIYLPFYVLWRGSMGNTLFYGVFLWILIRSSLFMRRKWRIRQGFCGRCGYVVSVNAGVAGASLNCTECGMAIPEQIKPRSHGVTESRRHGGTEARRDERAGFTPSRE